MRRRPSLSFNQSEAWEVLRTLEFKKRKLNSAIQQANFNHTIEFRSDTISLHEALETRKALNLQIEELNTQIIESAYTKVIYKEDRETIEEPKISYHQAIDYLDKARQDFRELNHKLRKASFEITVSYQDEL